MDQAAEEIRCFLYVGGFNPEDSRELVDLGPLLEPHIPELTDRFYRQLMTDPLTAPHVEGRVDKLKQTHQQWLRDLFCGNYGEDFVARQQHIGRVHVLAKIPPLFVAASMSFLRSQFPAIIQSLCKHDASQDCGKRLGILLRLLDFCQFLIDRAYEEDRMNRLCEATGMSRRLLENLVMLKK